VHLIKNQDPVMEGKQAEIAVARGESMHGGGGRIDESAECAGEDGLAAAGGSIEDQDGVGAGGAKGGDEPSQYRVPGVGGKVEELAERG